jgi:hypothetical protein
MESNLDKIAIFSNNLVKSFADKYIIPYFVL